MKTEPSAAGVLPVHAGMVDGEVRLGWGEVLERARSARALISGAGAARVASTVHCGTQLVITLLACRGLDVEVAIVGPWVPLDALDDVGPDCSLTIHPRDDLPCIVAPLPAARPRSGSRLRGGVWIFSSGTTGRAKAVRWDWQELTRGGAVDVETGRESWGIGYRPASFAGVSTTCQALGRAGLLEYLTPADLSRSPGCDGALDVASATPSFWRMTCIDLLRRGSGARRIQIACVGGEPVDQTLIDMLKSTVGPGRIRQLFGSTEFGVLLAIDDERPGIPAELLNGRLPSGVALAASGGLFAVSPAPGEPFLPTGDQVEILGDRAFIKARSSLMINVGGNKVDPLVVGQVMQRHPDVLGARAFTVRSPILGSVVGLDVVVRSNRRDTEAMLAELRDFARKNLRPHECPRKVRIVDGLPVAESGKLRTDE